MQSSGATDNSYSYPDHLNYWWRSWGDQRLNDLIQKAWSNNSDVRVAVARLKEVHARRAEVDAAKYPSLALLARSAREEKSDAVQSSHKLNLVASYEVDFWGRIATQRSSSEYDSQAQSWALALVQWSLAAQMAETYTDLIAINSKIASAGEARGTIYKSVKLINLGFNFGTHSILDLERAKADLAAADSVMESLRRLRLALHTRMALISGESAEKIESYFPDANESDLTKLLSLSLPAGSLEQAIRNRPDVQEALFLLASRDAAWVATSQARWPQITLTGDIRGDSNRISKIFSSGNILWSIAQGLAINLLDGGAANARTDQAHSRAEAARARYEHAIARALLEIREAYTATEINQSLLEAQQRRAVAMDMSVSMARVGYEAGTLALIDFLDVQRQALIARMSLADSQRDQILGKVAALKALGTGHSGAGRVLTQGAHRHGEY
ncbi:MAG: TolC family protein [Trichocoleus desertorum ATA4-8-CV12]|nr:TolC family protein [Trichocoleus desertorum ATA4-8-CV12]